MPIAVTGKIRLMEALFLTRLFLPRQSRIGFGSLRSGSQRKDTYHEGQEKTCQESGEEACEEEEEVGGLC
jgi:hypothetical protein